MKFPIIVVAALVAANTAVVTALAAPGSAVAEGGVGVGQQAPLLDGKYLDGQEPVARGASKALLISFWSATCPRAASVVPRLKEIAKVYKPEDLTLVGPSGDNETDSREFQKKFDIREYRLMYGAENALEAYEVEEYPTAFLVGSNGTIAWRGDPTGPEVDHIIAAVLAVSPSAEPGGTANGPPCCQTTMGGQQMMPGMMQQMMDDKPMGPEVMKQAGMPQDAMQRMMLLCRTPIWLDAPCPIYAQADTLGLSEQQKKKLVDIENEARAKAKAVLTPQQFEKLGPLPDKPVTMMETCPMMGMMKQSSAAPAGGDKPLAPNVLGVDEFMKNADKHRGEVDVEGIVSAAAQGRLSLIDCGELEKCGVTTCAELTLPVEWAGKPPEVKQRVRLHGKVRESEGKLSFLADKLEIVLPPAAKPQPEKEKGK